MNPEVLQGWEDKEGVAKMTPEETVNNVGGETRQRGILEAKWTKYFKKKASRDYPGGPVVKTAIPMLGMQVRSPGRRTKNPTSHMAKKKKERKKEIEV